MPPTSRVTRGRASTSEVHRQPWCIHAPSTRRSSTEVRAFPPALERAPRGGAVTSRSASAYSSSRETALTPRGIARRAGRRDDTRRARLHAFARAFPLSIAPRLLFDAPRDPTLTSPNVPSILSQRPTSQPPPGLASPPEPCFAASPAPPSPVSHSSPSPDPA